MFFFTLNAKTEGVRFCCTAGGSIRRGRPTAGICPFCSCGGSICWSCAAGQTLTLPCAVCFYTAVSYVVVPQEQLLSSLSPPPPSRRPHPRLFVSFKRRGEWSRISLRYFCLRFRFRLEKKTPAALLRGDFVFSLLKQNSRGEEKQKKGVRAGGEAWMRVSQVESKGYASFCF